MQTPESYALRDCQQRTALAAIANVNALAVPTVSGPRLVALFDGTNSSVNNPGSLGIKEQQTLVETLEQMRRNQSRCCRLRRLLFVAADCQRLFVARHQNLQLVAGDLRLPEFR